jgi:hypothetical protein
MEHRKQCEIEIRRHRHEQQHAIANREPARAQPRGECRDTTTERAVAQAHGVPGAILDDRHSLRMARRAFGECRGEIGIRRLRHRALSNNA